MHYLSAFCSSTVDQYQYVINITKPLLLYILLILVSKCFKHVLSFWLDFGHRRCSKHTMHQGFLHFLSQPKLITWRIPQEWSIAQSNPPKWNSRGGGFIPLVWTIVGFNISNNNPKSVSNNNPKSVIISEWGNHQLAWLHKNWRLVKHIQCISI